MKPITTLEDFGRMEELFRCSERARIVAYLKRQRKDDTDRPSVQVYDVLAAAVAAGEHWR